jgi:uncharacterized membrane protein
MAEAKTKEQKQFHRTRLGSMAVAFVALVLAYVLASAAIDSGNLFEYFTAIGLIMLAVNRFAHVVRISIGKAQNGHK